jgi:hypothetical protein
MSFNFGSSLKTCPVPRFYLNCCGDHQSRLPLYSRDIGNVTKKCMNIAPLQIVGYRALKNSVQSSLICVGEFSSRFHKQRMLASERWQKT